jgi:hypothetical protein
MKGQGITLHVPTSKPNVLGTTIPEEECLSRSLFRSERGSGPGREIEDDRIRASPVGDEHVEGSSD